MLWSVSSCVIRGRGGDLLKCIKSKPGALIMAAALFGGPIASTGFGDNPSAGLIGGFIVAFIAALGWGFEGCLAGYGTSLVDSEIGIAIRQLVAGLTNLIIIVPLFGLIAGNLGLSFELVAKAVTDAPSMIWLILGGLFAFLSFMTWYKSNSMCSTALGMACNGTYTFFAPFFCWIVLGLYGGIESWAISPIAWVAAIIMMFGILVIAVNPLDFFKKKEV